MQMLISKPMAEFSSLCHVKLLLVLLLVFSQVCSQLLAVSDSLVSFLPGIQGPLPFELETGYVGVGEAEEVQLFYYFVKSERNPAEDPLLLWLTGGPGCSTLTAMLFEIGPLNFEVQQYNGSLPKLILNPYSWTKVSSIIFLDSPVGTGFSYARSSFAGKPGDLEQVQHALQFLRKWLIDRPEFTSNPFFIGGDSYSGIPVPVLVQKIANDNEEGIKRMINLQGYLLGNPVTVRSEEINSRIPFAHGMGLIPDELYDSLKRSCRGDYENIDPSNAECLKNMQDYDKCTSEINRAHILELSCGLISPKPPLHHMLGKRRYLKGNYNVFLLSDSFRPILGCRAYGYLLAQYWANDPYVCKSLHVRKGSIGRWQRCDYEIPYDHDIHTSIQYHANLSAKGIRSIIYSGDHDMLVPFLATQIWIRSLNYYIVDDWRPWFVQGQVGGYTRTYSNRMTYATVKGAGHTAPEYRPEEALTMYERWMSGEPL